MKPELKTEVEIKSVARKLGWSLDKIESKATYSLAAKRFLRSKSAPVGFSDYVGCSDAGWCLYIEAKARGKLKTLRAEQDEFLREKIAHNAFAVVVDSGELLERLWSTFKSTPPEARQEFLLSLIPAHVLSSRRGRRQTW